MPPRKTYPSILFGLLQESPKVLVTFLLVVSHLPPVGNGFAVVYENVEEGVEEEDVVGLDRHRIEQDRLAPVLVERVRVERRLDHDQAVGDVVVVERVSVEGRLVRGVVEDVQELAPSEVVHELRVQAEVLLEPERRRVVFPVVGEPRAQSDQHAVHPAEHVRPVVDLGLEDGDAGHEHGGSLLVERQRDGRVPGRSAEGPRHRRDPQVELAGRVLVVGEELHQALAVVLLLLLSRSALAGDLEVDAEAGGVVDAADLPRARVADATLDLSDRGRLLVQ